MYELKEAIERVLERINDTPISDLESVLDELNCTGTLECVERLREVYEAVKERL